MTQQVWDYTVGGRKVIRSWFNYRKKTPGGRKSSPLDGVHVETWPSEWNGELIDLLTVLTRLVALEPEQARLLAEVVSGPLASRDDLSTRGAVWPRAGADPARKPRYTPTRTTHATQLGLPI